MLSSPVLSLALDDAAELVPHPRIAVVIGTAELAREAAALFDGAEVRLFDDVTALTEPAAGFSRYGLAPELVADADLVLGVLPKSLGELEDIATLVAAFASPAVTVTLAGREKYLTRGMNTTLESSFERVWASRGRQKSRALRAAGPRANVVRSHPVYADSAELGFSIASHGGTFAAAKLDQGTRVLLAAWDAILAAGDGSVASIVDLGCGTGILATAAALRLPSASVIATDRSWAAVTSTALTARRAGVADRVTTVQADAGAEIPDGTADLVLLNPPFHDGTAVDDEMAQRLFRASARMLRRGGTLAVVYNSHLPHRGALHSIVGPTAQITRTEKFTVTVSMRR